MKRRLVGSPILALLTLASGCASVPEKGGFEDVEQLVSERSGKRIVWNQGTTQDEEVSRAIASMLQEELRVDDAIQIALLNNRNLQALYEELGVAQADLVQAGLLRNPTLGFEIRFPGRPRPPVELHVIENFIDLFYLPLRKRAAGAAFESAKLRVAEGVLSLAAEVKATFYKLQGAQQQIELRRHVVQATDAAADAAQRMFDAGNITEIDLARERAMHEEARLVLASAEIDALDLRERMNQLLGLWGGDTRWKLSTMLPDLPKEEIALPGLESLAIAKRLDLAAVRQEIQGAAELLGLADYAGLFPELDLGVHMEREPDSVTTFGPSLDLPIPIFDQGQPAKAAAASRLRQARSRYAALAIEIRSEIRRAWKRLAWNRSRAEHLHNVVIPLRKRIVEQTQLEYNAMLVGVFSLLQAKQGEIDAGREYVEALTDYWSSTAELERAMGTQLDRRSPPAKESPEIEKPKEHSHGGSQ